MGTEAGSDNSTGSDLRERLLGTPSCSIPVGDLTDEEIDNLKERHRKALEKYGYLSSRES